MVNLSFSLGKIFVDRHHLNSEFRYESIFINNAVSTIVWLVLTSKILAETVCILEISRYLKKWTGYTKIDDSFDISSKAREQIFSISLCDDSLKE